MRASVRDLGLIAASTGVAVLLVKLAWRGFPFWGDNAESFLPLWHMWGAAIRQGQPFLFDHTGWGGANMVGEAAYELFNPFTALNAVFISFFDNLSIAGFFVATELMVILGWGVYGVARSYGARRIAAVVVGCVAPFAGFTLFYEAGNWFSGLMAIMWTMHFWWAAHSFARRRTSPLWAFVFGSLAALLGNPYAMISVLVVLVAVGLELLVKRDLRRFGGLVLIGVSVGLMLVLAFIALAYALPSTAREPATTFAANGNYLSPSLSDLVALSAPTYLPRMAAWGKTADVVPSTYVAWFLLPLVPWLRYGVLREWRRLFSLYALGGFFLLLTLGPDQVWLFRWPIRFAEYFFAALVIVFAVLLSRGFDRRRARLKITLTLVIVAAGGFMSWASSPQIPWHFPVAVSIVALLVLMFTAYRHWELRGVAAIAVVGTLGFALVQAGMFGWSHQHVTNAGDQTPPPSLSTVKARSSMFQGRVLQVADLASLYGTDAVARGDFVFGNIAAAAGTESINRYTGINFSSFSNAMGFDYRGSVHKDVGITYFFHDMSKEIPVPIVDVLGVDTIVAAKNKFDYPQLTAYTRGWHVVDEDPYRVVLVRDQPLRHPAIHGIGDVTIADARESGQDVTFRVRASTASKVVLDRLAWPGYTATLDGKPLTFSKETFGLLEVEIPAGSDGIVQMRYQVPGLRTGLLAAGIGTVLALGYQVVCIIDGRRRRGTMAAAPGITPHTS